MGMVSGCCCCREEDDADDEGTEGETKDESLWDIGPEIGKGTFGRCFVVTQRKDRQRFAAKVFSRKTSTWEAQSEFHTQLALCHPSIVSVRDLVHVIPGDTSLWLIMELCEGGTLQQRIDQGLSETQARGIFDQLVATVEFLVSRRVIHRDLNPCNVLFTGSRTKLADFGFAVNVPWPQTEKKTNGGDEDDEEVQIHGVCGRVDYMSYEMVTGQKYGLSADVWNLGIVLWAMLFGHSPFKSSNVMLCFQKIQVLPIRQLQPFPRMWTSISSDLQAILQGIIRPKPRWTLAQIRASLDS